MSSPHLQPWPEIVPLETLNCGANAAIVEFAFRFSGEHPVLWLHPQTLEILAASPSADRLLLGGAGSLASRNLHDMLIDNGRPLLRKALVELLAGADPGPGGHRVCLWLAGTPERSCEGWLSAYRGAEGLPLVFLRLEDRTDQRVEQLDQLETWVEEQAANYADLLDSIVDGFLALDREGRVQMANAGAQAILGRPAAELRGMRLEQIFPGVSSEMLAGNPSSELGLQLAHAKPGRPDAAEAGHKVLLPVRLGEGSKQLEFAVQAKGDGMGVLFRDVSEWIRHEVEIANLNATMAASQELLRRKNEELNSSLDQLGRLNDQLTKADALKGEFLANTSHELRTPLNSIIGFLQLIDEGLCEDEAERDGYIRNALASAKHLLSLINDLLDITRIEAGKMNFLIETQQVEDIFQEAYSITHIQAQQKGLKLSFDTPGSEALTVRADQHKCIQILVNLIGNAIKFTDEGGVEVYAEPVPGGGDEVRFVVRDSGIGVPTNQQRVIFEKFKQADGTSTRRYQGTGLGLAITKNLVEMMGGTIELHSDGEGCGTTVTFTLPSGVEQVKLPTGFNLDLDDLDDRLPDTF